MQRLSIFLCVLTSGTSLLAENKPDPAPAEPPRLEARAEGVCLTYRAVDVPRSKKVEQAEAGTLEKLEGTLVIEKALHQRQTTLPPGEYAVRVEAEPAGALFLVIEPANAPRDAVPEKGPRGEGGKERKPSRVREPGEETKKALEKKEGSGDADPAPAGPAGKEAPAEGKPPQERPQRIRAPLKLGGGAKSSSLGVELKLVSKGTRLRFTLRAGATTATASVRLGDST